MKVLQILPNLNSGGVERGTIDFAIFMHKQGIQNIVCSNGGALTTKLEEHNIQHYKLSAHTKNPFKIILNGFRLWRFIKRQNITVIHARSRAPAWSALIAARLAGIKFVTTWHGVYSLNGGFFKKLYNSIMARGDVVIAVSDFIKQHITKHYDMAQNKITVVNRWVDFDHFDKMQKENHAEIPKELAEQQKAKKKIILMPARFTEWKGQLVALDLLENIDQNSYNLVMVGKYDINSKYYQKLIAKIKQLNLQNAVSIYPAANDISGFYAAADFILAPTTRPEAFGRVVIETMYMQKIIIATDIGAPADNIKHGETGFKISLNDMYEARQMIAKIISMPKKNLDMIGKNAKKFVLANFSLNKMCQKKLQVYRDLERNNRLCEPTCASNSSVGEPD